MGEVRSTFEEIEAALKRAAAAMRDAGIEYALMGSVAGWARGAPQSRNDLDFLVRPEDAERALTALEEAGMKPERPPEGWLYKAWDEDGTLVDLIFGPKGIKDVGEVLGRAEIVSVAALDLPVIHLDDVLTMKLFAMDEHSCSYESVLALARAVREQINWDRVRERTAPSPFARAFFALIEGLHIVPAEDGSGAPPAPPRTHGAQIKVAGEPDPESPPPFSAPRAAGSPRLPGARLPESA